jgi:lysyl-tRNA synthetase, class II
MGARLDDIMQARSKIREDIVNRGDNPYPQDGHKNQTNAQALALPDGTEVVIAGRIRAIRGHGQIRFIDVFDSTGKIQVVVKSDVASNYNLIDDFQVGDFIRVDGERFLTQAQEPSVLTHSFAMLSKALRPLPDNWSGFSDEEERYRQRSVDLVMNPDVREVFKQRSTIVRSIRQTLYDEGYLEVETSSLQPLYGGANARPFVTHLNAWDMDQFLKISDELYLKRLIVGGFDRVFEIDHNFRNEGVDRTHNPEFTLMECYAAYADYQDMMTLTEKIYQNAALAVTGSTTIEYQGVSINLASPWRRLPMKEGLRELAHYDVDLMSDDELRAALHEHHLEYEGEWKRGIAIAKLFELVEPQLIQPTFVTDMPRETTSLCKLHRHDNTLIERFEPYIFGWEIGNAYTELNDPVLQRQFWQSERAGDPEAHPLDEDFLNTLEYGMPPTGGLGLGVDRLVMLLTNQTKIRDVILFPTMRPRSEE